MYLRLSYSSSRQGYVTMPKRHYGIGNGRIDLLRQKDVLIGQLPGIESGAVQYIGTTEA